MKNRKEALRLKRHAKIRLKMQGVSTRPRLVIRRSLKNFSAQIFDDTKNKVLYSLSTRDLEVKAKIPYGGNIKAAVILGEIFSQRLKDKAITQIIFDRAGYLYHGKVKAFADALRKGGLQF